MSRIQVKYHVEGRAFDTQEEAEQYLSDREFCNDLMKYHEDLIGESYDVHVDPETLIKFIKENKQRVLEYINSINNI